VTAVVVKILPPSAKVKLKRAVVSAGVCLRTTGCSCTVEKSDRALHELDLYSNHTWQLCQFTCGHLQTVGLWRLPRVYAIHVNRTQADGSRCSEALDFGDSIDLAPMLLYPKKGGVSALWAYAIARTHNHLYYSVVNTCR
jgi:hypothetical protein